MTLTRKIAILAHRLDGLFIKNPPAGTSLWYLVPKSHIWLRSVLKGKQVIVFNLKKELAIEEVSDDDIIKHSDISKVLREKKIEGFVTSHRGSHFLKRWAKDQKIELIGTHTDDQIFYENKIHFDRLLKKTKVPSPDSAEIKGPQKVFPYPFVVQEPSSFGSFGTFIVKDPKSWLRIRPKLLPSKIYLARRFIPGAAFGVTIYIDEFRIALSAIRQQCFFEGTDIFAGIQWRKTSHFKRKTVDRLNRTLLHLGMTLQDKDFFGFANIDFILQPSGDFSILECNPRLSSSSPHLFGASETFFNLPIAAMYLSMGTVADPAPFYFFPIPDSTFEGALLDVIYTGDPKKDIKQFLSGTYRHDIKFVSADIPNLNAKTQSFLYYAHTRPRNSVASGTQLATIISNFPLFNARGTLNRQGKLLHHHFTDELDS